MSLLGDIFHDDTDDDFNESNYEFFPETVSKSNNLASISEVSEYYSSVDVSVQERGPRLPPPILPEEIRKCPEDFVGLQNQGGTCYLNSLLQTLYLLPQFKHGIYSLDPETELGCSSSESAQGGENSTPERTSSPAQSNDSSKSGLKKSGLRELQSLFSRLDTSLETSVSTLALTKGAFEWGSSQAAAQHDVHELVTKLLERIHAELVGTSQASLVKDTFIGQAKENAVRCMGCGYTSGRATPFMTLFVNVDGFADLEASLDAQYCGTPERLEGSNAYKCDECGEVTDKELSQSITRLPPTLFLNLNRFKFDFNTLRRVKISTRFEFPTQLDMRRFAPDAETPHNTDSKVSTDPKDTTLELEASVSKHSEARPSNNDIEAEHHNAADASQVSEEDAFATSSSLEAIDDQKYTLVGIISHAGTGYGGHYMCYLRVDALCPERFQAINATQGSKTKDSSSSTSSNHKKKGATMSAPAREEWQVVDKSKKKSKGKGNNDSNTNSNKRRELDAAAWGNWFKFNDTQVQQVSTEELAQTFSGRSCAYLLVYSRLGTSQGGVVHPLVPAFWKSALTESNKRLLDHWQRYDALCNLTRFDLHILGEDAVWENPFVRLHVEGENARKIQASRSHSPLEDVEIDGRMSLSQVGDLLLSKLPNCDKDSYYRYFILSRAVQENGQRRGRHVLLELEVDEQSKSLSSVVDATPNASAHLLVLLCPKESHGLSRESLPFLCEGEGRPVQLKLTITAKRDTTPVWYAIGSPAAAIAERLCSEIDGATSSDFYVSNHQKEGKVERVLEASNLNYEGREVFYAESKLEVESELARRLRVKTFHIVDAWPRDREQESAGSCSPPFDITLDPAEDSLLNLLAQAAGIFGRDLEEDICLEVESSGLIVESDDELFGLARATQLGLTTRSGLEAKAAQNALQTKNVRFSQGGKSGMIQSDQNNQEDMDDELESKDESRSSPSQHLSERIKFALVSNNDPLSPSLTAQLSPGEVSSDVVNVSKLHRSKPVSWKVDHSMGIVDMKQDALDALLSAAEPENAENAVSSAWRLRLTNWAGEACDLIPEAKLGEMPDEELNEELQQQVAQYMQKKNILQGEADEVASAFRAIAGSSLGSCKVTSELLGSLKQSASISELWRALGPPASCIPLEGLTLKDALQDVRGADEILVERGKVPIEGFVSLSIHVWNPTLGSAEEIVSEIVFTENELQSSLRGALTRGLLLTVSSLTSASETHPLCRTLAVAVMADNLLVRKLEYCNLVGRYIPTGLVHPKMLGFKWGGKSVPKRIPIPVVLHPVQPEHATLCAGVATKHSSGSNKHSHVWLCEFMPRSDGATCVGLKEMEASSSDSDDRLIERAAAIVNIPPIEFVLACHNEKTHRWEIIRMEQHVAADIDGDNGNKQVKKSKAKTKRDRLKRKFQHGSVLAYIRARNFPEGVSTPSASLFDTAADLDARSREAEAAEKRKAEQPQPLALTYSPLVSSEAELRLGGDSDFLFADYS